MPSFCGVVVNAFSVKYTAAQALKFLKSTFWM